jgi:hypothetical protein
MVLKTKRKKILKKLHPDNKNTGNEILFNHASEFFQISSSTYDFNIQKRNLFVLGKSMRKEDSAETNKIIYDLVQETGIKFSIAMFSFSLLNALLLFTGFKLWSKIIFFLVSLVFLIAPLGVSFMVKIMMLDLNNPTDFRSATWLDFLKYAHLVNNFFPGFSLQELEYVVLHLAVFWLISLAISLPRYKRNMIKDLIETHREVKKISRGEDIDVNLVYMKVKVFINTYSSSSFWTKFKKCFSFVLFIVFIFVLPALLK